MDKREELFRLKSVLLQLGGILLPPVSPIELLRQILLAWLARRTLPPDKLLDLFK